MCSCSRKGSAHRRDMRPGHRAWLEPGFHRAAREPPIRKPRESRARKARPFALESIATRPALMRLPSATNEADGDRRQEQRNQLGDASQALLPHPTNKMTRVAEPDADQQQIYEKRQ